MRSMRSAGWTYPSDNFVYGIRGIGNDRKESAVLQQENRKADIRYVTAAATNRLAAMQFPLFMFLMVAGHDLIILLYTRAYEKSASIFQVSILLLPIGIFLLDPIVRAYKELRNFVLRDADRLFSSFSFVVSFLLFDISG